MVLDEKWKSLGIEVGFWGGGEPLLETLEAQLFNCWDSFEDHCLSISNVKLYFFVDDLEAIILFRTHSGIRLN